MAGLEDYVLGTDDDQYDQATQEAQQAAFQVPPSALVTGGAVPGTLMNSILRPENILPDSGASSPSLMRTDPNTGNVTMWRNPATMNKPQPRITTVGQLSAIMKHLKGVPQELQLQVLSNLTGIPLATTAQRQKEMLAMRNELAKPYKDAMMQLRQQQAKSVVDSRRQAQGYRHQQLMNNTLTAMGHLTSLLDKVVPGSEPYNAAVAQYMTLAKQYKKLSGIDLEDSAPKPKAAAGNSGGAGSTPAANPSGSRTGPASFQDASDQASAMRAFLEAAGAKRIQ